MRFDDHPPAAESYCYPIVRCKPRYPLKVTLLQRQITGLWTHYWGGKTIACTGAKYCEACKEGCKLTWAGYILARRHDDDHKILCAVTRPVKTELDSMEDTRHALFGLRIRLIRVGRNLNSPVKCECFGRDLMNEEVPKTVTEVIMMRLFADNANKATVESR